MGGSAWLKTLWALLSGALRNHMSQCFMPQFDLSCHDSVFLGTSRPERGSHYVHPALIRDCVHCLCLDKWWYRSEELFDALPPFAKCLDGLACFEVPFRFPRTSRSPQLAQPSLFVQEWYGPRHHSPPNGFLFEERWWVWGGVGQRVLPPYPRLPPSDVWPVTLLYRRWRPAVW